LLVPLKKLVVQSRTHWKWLIILATILAIPVLQPKLWPGGVGFKADKSVTTTIEKDPQEKITKTIETTKPEPGKTLWDWLSLLGVPITLVLLGYKFQRIQQQRAEELAKEQRELAADETKEEVLQVYFDRLSALLLDKNLLVIAAEINSQESKELLKTEEKELLDSSVDVIRARTLSILRRFRNDGERKGIVIRFLIEADVMSKLNLSLRGADLSFADLQRADLRGVNLIEADISSANLVLANLSDANLSGANLRGADLAVADLSNASLRDADLTGAKLGAILRGADLTKANLTDANLERAILCDADLNSAKLYGADIRGANLYGAKINGVDLSGIKNLSPTELKSVEYLERAKYNGKRLCDPVVQKKLGLDTKPES
jgi:uncharacterized protein YjbI with pentapeptide repeats